MLDLEKYKVIIFDNDGVLVDSEYLSCYALNVLFENMFGVDIGRDYSKVLGTSDEYAIKHYLKKHGINKFDLENLKIEKGKIYFEIAKDKLKTFPHLERLLLKLKGIMILAVASSGSHEKIKFSLDQIKFNNYFDYIFSTDDVSKGKPNPDLFLHTAKVMKLKVGECVVIEDSINGIKAAKSANMDVIGFTSSFSEEELKGAGADIVISSFEELIDW